LAKLTYLSLGSNIGDRERNLRTAIERLAAPGLRALRTSPVYETEPVDVTDQRWFLNLVVEAETTLFPCSFWRECRRSSACSAVRTVPKGPRIIDIDILLYGTAVMRGGKLEIPHPRMAERRFVLVPSMTSPQIAASGCPQDSRELLPRRAARGGAIVHS